MKLQSIAKKNNLRKDNRLDVGGSNILISLIIVAFKRKEFIRDAIASAIRQRISKEKLEVIVIKNFIDKEIDDFIKSQGFVGIVSKNEGLGEKLHEAIEICSGEVITFLEDDDVMSDSRISVIHNTFLDGDIVYFHNNVERFFDLNLMGADQYNLRNTEERIEIVSENDIHLPQLISRNCEFNISSMAVRRRIFDNYWKEIASFNYKVDNFIFYLAVSAKGKIAITAKKLTFYRFHASASHIFTSSHNYLEERITMYKKLEEESNRLAKTFNNIILRSYLECRKLEQSVIIGVLNRKERDGGFQFLAKCLSCSLRIRRRFFSLLLVLYFVGIFLPNFALRVYVSFEARKE